MNWIIEANVSLTEISMDAAVAAVLSELDRFIILKEEQKKHNMIWFYSWLALAQVQWNIVGHRCAHFTNEKPQVVTTRLNEQCLYTIWIPTWCESLLCRRVGHLCQLATATLRRKAERRAENVLYCKHLATLQNTNSNYAFRMRSGKKYKKYNVLMHI